MSERAADPGVALRPLLESFRLFIWNEKSMQRLTRYQDDALTRFANQLEEVAALLAAVPRPLEGLRRDLELQADCDALAAACRAALDWYGLDGDHISDPVRSQLLAALAAVPRPQETPDTIETWAAEIVNGHATKAESQVEWEIVEALKKAYRLGRQKVAVPSPGVSVPLPPSFDTVMRHEAPDAPEGPITDEARQQFVSGIVLTYLERFDARYGTAFAPEMRAAIIR